MRNITLCEDNVMQLLMLESIVERYFENKKEDYKISKYTSGKALLDDLVEGYLDTECILLDIEMPGLNGLETAKQIRKHNFNVPIVFITSHADYGEQSYEVHASGYLVKPYDLERISRVLNYVLKERIQQRITITVHRQKRYIKTDDIIYIESDKRAITLHLQDGTSLQFNSSMNKLEEQLNSPNFIRCHQSYIVNMDYIDDIQDGFILKDKTQIPIRVRYRKDVEQQFLSYYNRTYKHES